MRRRDNFVRSGPLLQDDEVRRDKYAGKLVPVADERGLCDEHVRLELVFDGLRSDEFSARGLQQLLLAVGNVEKPIVVEVSDVSGLEPAIILKGLGCGDRLLPIALKDGRPADEQFPIGCNFALQVGQDLAD